MAQELELSLLKDLLAVPEPPKYGKGDKRKYALVAQTGPLRWVEKETRCASRGCGSPTHCKVEGIPYCMMHSLRRLNEMLANLGVIG